MKKLLALSLILLLAIGMMACSTYGKVQKAFEKEGYILSEEVESAIENVKEEIGEDLVTEIHVMYKVDGLKSTAVAIFEFKATDKMIEAYKESETLQGFVKDVSANEDAKAFYNALVDAGYANGNCLVFTVNPLSVNEVTTIVKNA